MKYGNISEESFLRILRYSAETFSRSSMISKYYFSHKTCQKYLKYLLIIVQCDSK